MARRGKRRLRTLVREAKAAQSNLQKPTVEGCRHAYDVIGEAQVALSRRTGVRGQTDEVREAEKLVDDLEHRFIQSCVYVPNRGNDNDNSSGS